MATSSGAIVNFGWLPEGMQDRSKRGMKINLNEQLVLTRKPGQKSKFHEAPINLNLSGNNFIEVKKKKTPTQRIQTP